MTEWHSAVDGGFYHYRPRFPRKLIQAGWDEFLCRTLGPKAEKWEGGIFIRGRFCVEKHRFY